MFLSGVKERLKGFARWSLGMAATPGTILYDAHCLLDRRISRPGRSEWCFSSSCPDDVLLEALLAGGSGGGGGATALAGGAAPRAHEGGGDVPEGRGGGGGA
eukprot:2678972-Prymnesium_polylepis.1